MCAATATHTHTHAQAAEAAAERDRAAAEREAMQTCEWDTARLDWRGIQPNEIGWRTVRVFISSTFNDFHSERDALTRSVFPQLEELCLPLQVVRVSCMCGHVRYHRLLPCAVLMGRGSYLWTCDGG